MRGVIFTILVLFEICRAFPQDIHWNPEPMIIKNGINDRTVYDISSSKEGFLWLATDEGITRYDGFRFRNYPLVTSLDSTSIPLNQVVKSLKESQDGLLYLQLFQGGMTCFDKKKEIYLPLHFDKPFNIRGIQDFCWNGETLYLATTQGLFSSTSQRVKEDDKDIVSCTLKVKPLVKGNITHLCADGKTNLYLVIDGDRVVRYDLATGKSSLMQQGNVVNRIFLMNGYLWICKSWSDLVCYDLKSGKERMISIGTIDKVDYSTSYITDLTCKNKKIYYLTTLEGLFRLEFDNEDLSESPYSLEAVVQNEGRFGLRMDTRMMSVCWDNDQKNLWTSGSGGGIAKFDISNNMYNRVKQEFKSRVHGMVEDAKGYVWLVMNDGKIMKSTTPEFSINTSFELWTKSSDFFGHYHIYKDQNECIWLGNNHGEVVWIDPDTDTKESFQLQTKEGEKMDAAIYQFCMDSRKRLWVATSHGLMQVDPGSRACSKIEPLNEKIDGVLSVAEDKEGNIWLGTNKGLKRLEWQGERILLVGNYERENRLEESAVRTVFVNNYNQIYAVYLNAIVRIDGRDKEKFESIYTLGNGLTCGHVSCMVDDQVGNTWGGNSVGIITIRNGGDSFYNYLSAGACVAVCRLHDGQLLWADSKGLIYFDPEVVKSNTGSQKLLLTDIEVNGESIMAGETRNGQMILSSSPDVQKELVFNSDNNDFRLYFSDLCFETMQRKIAYRLLPLDKDWHVKSLSEGLGYNRLPAGKYILEAKLIFLDAKESGTIEIPIVVKSEWYYTIWVYVIYGLLVAALVYFIFRRFRVRDIRRQVRRNREMILKENLNLEKMKHEQKVEIDAMRNRLLTLFVQELRTPLSLIIAPLKDLLEEQSLVPHFASRAQMAYRNSLRMLDVCNQLLAIYEQGNQNEKLEVTPCQIEKLIDGNLFDYRELLKAHPITFQFEKRIKKNLECYVDKKKLETILHNLLSNAFTHTNYTGTVSLTVCETMERQMHYVTIIVEDNGKGWVKTTEQLMNDKVQENDIPSVQLGFTFMRHIVEMHHGIISLESIEGKGTKVVVSLPLGKTVFENDPNVVFVNPDTSKNDMPESQQEQLLTDMATNDILKQKVVVPAEISISEETKASSVTGSKKTLLIVEDHKDIRLYLKVLLGKEYNLLMATNGQEGVDIAKKELPDLIICDVMMPVKDGFECCREVKEGLETCNIPFIMLTAKVEDEDIIHGLEMGADDYILKPFTPGILKAKIHNLINGRIALKQIYTRLFTLPGMDNVTEKNEADTAKDKVKVEDPFISSVIKIVEDNICEADFSVKKLASEMNMSQPTLYRKVKQSTDYTIIELIRGVRMRRAAVLLKTKRYGVQDVAEMVGYNDIPTFRKHFVDAFGTTPSTYE
ncbi:hybrid sensor histidine kinase/response regulator transcription factor [Bacteroides faecalis]|nr:response regulator [Bacteroides faecalis]